MGQENTSSVNPVNYWPSVTLYLLIVVWVEFSVKCLDTSIIIVNVVQKFHLIVSQIISDCSQQLFGFNPLITQNCNPGIGTNTDTVEVFYQDVGVQMAVF